MVNFIYQLEWDQRYWPNVLVDVFVKVLLGESDTYINEN